MAEDADFRPKSADTGTIGTSATRVNDKPIGRKREYLMAFETLPAQMLNVYGPAKYMKLSDGEVWKHFAEPLKTGAVWMTEYCSKEDERRGVGFNRWAHSQLTYCRYQLQDHVKEQNQFVLAPEIYKELYDEISEILPALEYCLAPKKAFEKKGASSLRSGVAQEVPVSNKDPTLLDKHGKQLYDWLDPKQRSRIRMLQNFQAAGGLSFVASVHHRASKCFKGYGNSLHTPEQPEVSLQEWQACIKARHTVGSTGMEQEEDISSDFKKK